MKNFVVIAILLLCQNLNAQENTGSILNWLQEGKINYSNSQINEISRISDEETISEYYLARITDVRYELNESNTSVTIKSPFSETLHVFSEEYTEYIEMGYVWYGKEIGSDNWFSYIEYEGFIRGELVLSDKYFEYEDIGDGLIYFNESSYDGNDLVCGVQDNIVTEGTNHKEEVSIKNMDVCDVDIAAFYTERFREKYDGNNNYSTIKTKSAIISKISELNYSRQSSLLDELFKVRLTGIYSSSIEEVIGQDVADTKDLVIEPLFITPGGELYDVREADEADVIAVFTDGRYLSTGAKVMGSAGTTVLNSDRAFLVMEYRGMRNRKKRAYNFTHEFWHINTAQHMNTAVPAYPFAAFHEVFINGLFNPSKMTVMVTGNLNGNRRVTQELSNPDISEDGSAYGIENVKDNARTVSESVCDVSEYVTASYNPLNISIVGDAEVCPCTGLLNLQANVSGGQDPFTYQWKYKYDLGSFNTINTSLPQVNIPVPCNWPAQTIFVELRVFDAAGYFAFTSKVIDIEDYKDCWGYAGEDDSFKLKASYPNPVSNNLILKIEKNGVEGREPIIIKIVSTQGQIVKIIEVDQQYLRMNEEIELNLDLSDLKKGSYKLKINNDLNSFLTFIKL